MDMDNEIITEAEQILIQEKVKKQMEGIKEGDSVRVDYMDLGNGQRIIQNIEKLN
jgi:hypothetical protein